MTISDQLKQTIDELEIEKHLSRLIAQAEEAVLRAVTAAGDYAHEHGDDIAAFVQRAGSAVNERTDDRFASVVESVSTQLNRGVAKLAEQRAAEPTDPDEPAA
ncbi:MAG: hypothetical protein R2731_07235 [Nocardioides sp.]